MRRPSRLVTAVLFALAAAATLAAQDSAPKAGFVRALGRFAAALEGAYGDEGDVLRSSLAAMEEGLDRWDQAIRTSEAAIRNRIARADVAAAAPLRVSLAGLYLERGRLDDAVEALDEARSLAPERSDVYTLLGLAYDQLADRPVAATGAFRQAADLASSDPVPAYVLARHLARLGDTDAARDARQRFLAIWEQRATGPTAPPKVAAPFIRLGLIQEATDVDPFFPPALYADGFARLRQGRYREAIAAFRDAAARDPLTAAPGADAAALALATAAFRNGALETAARHLETAIDLAPKHAEPHRILGLVYLADERYEQAIDALQTASGLAPGDERARLALAYVLTETGQAPAAERVLQDTLARLPASGRARYSLASLYERQTRNVEAVREFEAAAAFHPLSGLNTLYRTIGRLRFELRDLDGTIAAYEARITVHPNDPDAHRLLGQAYQEQGRDEEALAEFAVAVLMAPDHQDAWGSLADAYLGLGRFDRAERAARRALDLDPTLKQARYTLATALMRLGRPEEGRAELQRYQRLQAAETAEQARAYELSGLRRAASVSVASGDYVQAVAALRKALLLDPASAASHMSLGLALLGAGQVGEAIERLQTAAALNAPPDVHRHLADAYAALGRDEDSRRERDTYERLRRQAAASPPDN